jgi:hypothetical protein
MSPADVMNARTSEESIVASRGPAVVEGGARCRSWAESNGRRSSRGACQCDDNEYARRSWWRASKGDSKMRSNLGAGRVAHTSQGGDMILCNRKSTSSEPGHMLPSTDARSMHKQRGSVRVASSAEAQSVSVSTRPGAPGWYCCVRGYSCALVIAEQVCPAFAPFVLSASVVCVPVPTAHRSSR